jgi:cysteine desulfurase/selenocysteine lyase
MIKEVPSKKTTYAELPHKFEAGTPNIAAGIVLGTAVDYMNEVGFDNIQLQELELLEYGTKRLLEIEGLRSLVLLKETPLSLLTLKNSSILVR